VGPQPGANPIPDGPRPPTEAQVQAAKSKTSRISLDAAIGAAEAAGVQAAPDAPKTIRLKRPTEMPTVKVAIVPPPSAAAVSAHATSSIPSLATVSAKATAPIPPMNVLMAPPPPASQTARIPDTAVASDNAPITQKRTIRVKRPAAMVISGGGGEAAADEGAGVAGAPAVAVPIAPDTAHWAFNFAAVLTILLTLALLVVFSSQIFGPNASLTELSVWATGPDLPLPGTVSGN
jgi:hypothetical protein